MTFLKLCRNLPGKGGGLVGCVGGGGGGGQYDVRDRVKTPPSLFGFDYIWALRLGLGFVKKLHLAGALLEGSAGI